MRKNDVMFFLKEKERDPHSADFNRQPPTTTTISPYFKRGDMSGEIDGEYTKEREHKRTRFEEVAANPLTASSSTDCAGGATLAEGIVAGGVTDGAKKPRRSRWST
jgi:hypothetical protein